MIKDKIRTAVFLCFLFTLTILSLFTKERAFSETENRFLAKRPVFTKESLFSGEFSEAYEAFITDQFCFRDRWIFVKTMAERSLLKKDSNGVYFGREGYLLEKHDAAVFTSRQADSNVDALVSFLNDRMNKMGADRVRFLAVPTASEVLLDKLPLFASPYPQSGFIETIRSKLQDPQIVLDCAGAFKEKREEYIYYRTDHHWTAKGAFYAYQDYIGSLGLTPYEESDFTVELGADDFYGTLSSKVNLFKNPDSIYLYTLKKPPQYRLTYDEKSREDKTSLYDRAALKERDKYKVYLGGNHGLIQIKTGRNTGRNLLLIKDSFANCFVPFAVNHFDTAYVVDLRYFNMDIGLFMDKHPVTDILVLYNTANLAADQNLWKLGR